MGVLDECCGHMVRKAKPLTKQDVLDLAKGCTSRSEFKNKYPTAYRMACRKGLIELSQSHIESARKHWSLDLLRHEALKYKTRKEFEKGSLGAYSAALRTKVMDDICSHMLSLRNVFSFEDVLASAALYRTRSAWKNAEPNIYASARRNGWLEQATAHMTKLMRENWTKAEVFVAASGFNNPTSFKDACSGAWSVAQRDGYLKEVCAHMVRLAHKPSDQEQAIFEYVIDICPDAIQSDNSTLGGKQLDILIPSLKVAIEFNGLYWHSSRTGRSRTYHQEKTDAAAAAGYRLIHIWSDEWIEKQDIIKAYLRMQLVGPDRRIGARKCSIVPLEPEVALPFHRMFHLQGGRGGEHFGLYHRGELLAVATVQGVELARWTVRFGTVIVGGLSKVIKHIGRRIISYCDTAKHTGAGYLAAGFKLVGVSAPSYYYTDGNRRFNRMGFQKHRLLGQPGAKGNTEIELAASLGFYQVGGTRQLKFEIGA